MNKPILTIGIPVFNGMPYIERTVMSIVEQEAFVSGEVVLSLHDNCSNDGSWEKCQELASKYSTGVRVYRNLENVGYDNNVLSILSSIDTKFVWLLGCQDCVIIGALGHLISVLKTTESKWLFANFVVYEEANSKISSDEGFGFEANKTYSELIEVFKESPSAGMPLSCNILESCLLQELGSELMLQGWAHLEMLYKLAVRKGFASCTVISEPLFKLYREKGGWWEGKGVLENFLSYGRILEHFAKLDSTNTFITILRNSFDALSNSLSLAQKAGYRPNLKGVIEICHLFQLGRLRTIHLFLLVLLPKRFAGWIYPFIRKRWKGLGRLISFGG